MVLLRIKGNHDTYYLRYQQIPCYISMAKLLFYGFLARIRIFHFIFMNFSQRVRVVTILTCQLFFLSAFVCSSNSSQKKSTDMGCGASAPAGGAAVKLHSKIRW